jgi:glycosyltransferase involved in cell wall biosynthesis
MNEASFVGTALESLRAQTYPADRLEIIVVDGGSTDRTLEVLDQEARKDPRIRVLGGPGVNCPAALNIGIAEARGSIVWYLGGHGQADPEYLEIAVKHLAADPALGSVGGLIIPTGEGRTARSNMIARFSVFGVGRGYLTTSATVHTIDTVQWGAYRKDALEQAGLFDPGLQFGEDEELNFRIRRAGFLILYDPALRITYFARASLKSLFRQYRNYGGARVRVLRKHPSFFSLKHAAPATLVAALVVAAILPLISIGTWPLSVLIVGSYAALIVIASLYLALRERFRYPHYLAASLMCLHMGYGLGTMLGVVGLARKR